MTESTAEGTSPDEAGSDFAEWRRRNLDPEPLEFPADPVIEEANADYAAWRRMNPGTSVLDEYPGPDRP